MDGDILTAGILTGGTILFLVFQIWSEKASGKSSGIGRPGANPK